MPDNRPYNRAGRGQELTNALARPSPSSFDEWGTPYDAEGNSLAQPPMSWGEMALTGLASPVQLGIGLGGALSPYSPQDGWRVPPGISEPIHAGQRLFSQGGTFEQNPTPESEKDMQTVLLSLYGGNALNPLAKVPKGSLAAGSMKEAEGLGSALASQMSIEDQIASITNKTRPYRAAMRFGDEIFQGVNHGVALANAEAKLGDKVWENWNSKTGYPDGTEGFVTRDGTFLTRNEAARATPGYYNPDGEMHASSLKDYNLLSDQKPSLLGSALASQMGDGSGIIAYHGSPHSFDKFDMSKIGTGEGAQAYGYGLYFAENEGVAKNYRDTLSRSDNIDPVQRAKATAGQFGGSENPTLWDDIADHATTMRKIGNIDSAVAYEADLDLLKRAGQIINDAPSPGHMYQVRINANPNDFLDWDKPLSQQSEKVRNAAQSLPRTEVYTRKDGVTKTASLIDLEGDAFYNALAEALGRPYDPAKPRVSEWLNHTAASQALKEAGIPGVRYLDQMSRNAGDGTSNYVVFNDSIIDILKKYGLAGMSLYGAGNALSDKTTY